MNVNNIPTEILNFCKDYAVEHTFLIAQHKDALASGLLSMSRDVRCINSNYITVYLEVYEVASGTCNYTLYDFDDYIFILKDIILEKFPNATFLFE